MALPLAIPLIASGIGTAGALFESFRGGGGQQGPDFGQLRQDLIQQNQLRAQQTRTRSASDTRARLRSQGIGGGSGVVNRIIADQNARISGQFESARQQGLSQLTQQEIQSGQFQQQQQQQQQQNRVGAFAGIGALGIQGLGFTEFGGGGDQGLQGLQQTQQFGLQDLQNIFGRQANQRQNQGFQFQNPINLGQQQQFNPQLQGGFA